MWLKSEIDELASLYDEVEDQKIIDYLSTEALAAIQSCGPITVSNLRNYMLVPKHNLNPKTIRLSRLVKNLDLKIWLEKIENVLIPTFPMTVEIGFSFLAQKNEEIIYVFCPKALASYTGKFVSKTKYQEFLNEVKSKKKDEHLQNTFFNTISGNPFTTSGYRPLCLISNTIWITK